MNANRQSKQVRIVALIAALLTSTALFAGVVSLADEPANATQIVLAQAHDVVVR